MCLWRGALLAMRPFLATFGFLSPAANKCRSSVRVLVPGAGLGRLAFDIARKGEEELIPSALMDRSGVYRDCSLRFQLPRYVGCLHQCIISGPREKSLNYTAITGNEFSFYMVSGGSPLR